MEDYKEKYEKALKTAKLLADNSNDEICKKKIEAIFPELKESEDEKIKEVIINVFDISEPDETWGDTNITTKDIIAWLEKQGEHANFRNQIQIGDEVTRNEDGVLVNLSQLNRVAKPAEKKGEQKPTNKVEPKFKIGDTIVVKDLDEYDYETIKDIKDGQYIFTDGYCMNIDEQEGWQLVKTPTINELPNGEDYGIDSLYHAARILEKLLAR